MMDNFSRMECPECNGYETERIEIVVESDELIENRACNGCYAGYIIRYGDPTVETTHEPEER